jgi:hypothetical protein
MPSAHGDPAAEIIAVSAVDLSAVRAALARLGVEVVEPARVFGPVTGAGRGWLPEADFLCALFP